VLWTGRDFSIIDFEGEPMRSLGERRLKRSALMDVAGLLRSLQYASAAGIDELAQRGAVPVEGDEHDRLRRWADFWRQRAEAAFLAGYLATITPPIVPDDDHAVRILLDAWLLQKASYELAYELNNRPDWVTIPLRGITALLDAPAGA
jgi:maltose alpha-D-glucosyltransferase/alpha-amylase